MAFISLNNFEKIYKGKQLKLYKLKNSANTEVALSNFGARIISIVTPDKKGSLDDIALGYATINEYIDDKVFMGGIVGRYANRIANGRFEIGENVYQVSLNDGQNTLHGGKKGFDKRIWETEQKGNSVIMKYTSEDDEEGFPGRLEVEVIFSLNDSNELEIKYNAITNRETIVNLTNHSYFNLKGDGKGPILGHILQINSDYITEVDSNLIPTGKLIPVDNTPFDFRQPKTIGKDIENNNPQLKLGNGYDHNWVLNKESEKVSLAASLYEPVSGRAIEIKTTKPGLQFFSGNFENSKILGKNGSYYNTREGLALEAQYFPDSPNNHGFPSTVLNPGENYHHKTIYSFHTKE